MVKSFKNGYKMFLNRPLDRAQSRDLYGGLLTINKIELTDLVKMVNSFKFDYKLILKKPLDRSQSCDLYSSVLIIKKNSIGLLRDRNNETDFPVD
jgi:hypothetical protein